MHFKDKVIWITGASSGIGKELALQLSQQHAKLLLTARRKEALVEVQLQCKQQTPHCHILAADLYDSADIKKLAEAAIDVYGHIDVIIHCAGVSQRSLAVNTTEEVYRQLMEINFFAPVNLTRYLLPHFASKQNGHIVILNSMAGLMGFPMRSGYSAAKHAVKGFFETLQTEHNIPNLEITIVSPGRINTPISLSALTADGSKHNHMDAGQLNGISVQRCAEKIIHAIHHKKKHVIIARGERLLWWFWWFLPSLYYRIARNTGLKAVLLLNISIHTLLK